VGFCCIRIVVYIQLITEVQPQSHVIEAKRLSSELLHCNPTTYASHLLYLALSLAALRVDCRLLSPLRKSSLDKVNEDFHQFGVKLRPSPTMQLF
jgi:hypothetical protein